jgi:hypothetical protein
MIGDRLGGGVPRAGANHSALPSTKAQKPVRRWLPALSTPHRPWHRAPCHQLATSTVWPSVTETAAWFVLDPSTVWAVQVILCPVLVILNVERKRLSNVDPLIDEDHWPGREVQVVDTDE